MITIYHTFELPSFLFSGNYTSPSIAFEHQHLSSFPAVLMAQQKYIYIFNYDVILQLAYQFFYFIII